MIFLERAFRTILLHEFRLMTRDGSPWIAAILFGVAVILGVSVGSSYRLSEQALVDEVAEKEADAARRRASGVEEFLKAYPVSSEDDWYALWSGKDLSPKLRSKSMGFLAQTVGATPVHPMLPATNLAMLSIGRRDSEPSSAEVSIWNSRLDLWNRDRIDNPANMAAGRFDLAFVLVYIYPLLVIVFCYGLLSSERDRGTLSLLLAQGVSPRSLLLGKLVPRLGAAMAVGIGFAGLGIWTSGAPIMNTSDLYHLAAGAALVAAYGAFWAALTLAVDAAGKSSTTAVAVLGAAWLAFVLLAPATIDLAVNFMVPVPSRMELIQAHRRESLELEKDVARTLAAFHAEHPDLATKGGGAGPKNKAFAESHAVRVEADRRVGRLAGRFESQLEGQRRLLGWAGLAVPTLLVQEGLDELSGSSITRHGRFRRQAEQFHASWLDYFVPKMFRNELMMPDDHRAFPRFTFVEELGRTIEGRVWIAAAKVLATAVVIASLAWRRLPKVSIVPAD